jgi:hypothetical protein
MSVKRAFLLGKERRKLQGVNARNRNVRTNAIDKNREQQKQQARLKLA